MHLYRIIFDLFSKPTKEKIASHLTPYLPSKSAVLDVGSGDGYMADAVESSSGCSVRRMDVVDVSITGLKPDIYDGAHFPYPDNAFRSSMILFVLHHVKDKETVLREASRVSKDTILILEDIPYDVFDTILGAWHKINSRIKYKSSYISYRSDREWKTMFKKIGLRLVHESDIDRFINPTHPSSKKLYVLRKVH